MPTSELTRLYFIRVEELLQDLRNRMADVYKKQEDSLTLRLLFAEWTRVCRHTMTPHELYKQFAKRVSHVVRGITLFTCQNF